MFRIGAQLYTVREYTKTLDDVKTTLEKIAAMGWKSVQVSGFGAMEASAVKEQLDKNGLSCDATHISFERMQNDFDGVVKEHKTLGCVYAGIGSMPSRYQENADTYKTFAKDASIVAKKLKDNGLEFIYHNHAFELRRFGKLTGMDILLSECSDDVQFELDTYWVQCGGADPVKYIGRVAGRIDVIHFKDMAGSAKNTSMMTEIGEGSLDWPEIVKACEKAGVRYAFVEQDECAGGDPFASLKISYDYLRSLGLEP